ncbi:hypothetical protein Catovirus_1_570 [Catovirus CTV1]|uniref:Uncharacterized protein n=1 Tax=Catovirus CTV1 TaxID=1977631 RepID=A0A1V0S9Y2_9VIRU|nr:hypothetical protein Catovirus_1_570 [Catovirus CTV1]
MNIINNLSENERRSLKINLLFETLLDNEHIYSILLTDNSIGCALKKLLFDQLIILHNDKKNFPCVNTEKWLNKMMKVPMENSTCAETKIKNTLALYEGLLKNHLDFIFSPSGFNELLLIFDNLCKYMAQHKWYLDIKYKENGGTPLLLNLKNQLIAMESVLTPEQLAMFNPSEYYELFPKN